ncbi:hypothetical protein [Streptomyces sp. NPDC056660]|uniref:hypothetical protein n=1 Tax=Streptomyces sp. NPDC056660 TaxID=3345897 RepID=UPI0036C68027
MHRWGAAAFVAASLVGGVLLPAVPATAIHPSGTFPAAPPGTATGSRVITPNAVGLTPQWGTTLGGDGLLSVI